jgi:hypothetical protein
VLKNLMFYFSKGICNFGYVVGVYFPQKCNETELLSILNWSANKSKPLFVVHPITGGEGVGAVSLESDRVDMQRGLIF